MEPFSQRLRLLRKQRGLTIKQVAGFVGVPLSTYREWEYGRAIQGEPYVKIAEVLSVSLSELMTGRKEHSEVLAELEQIEKHVKNLWRILSVAH